jgi:NADH:ubiquinone oxidoreductase subunit 4 (subunit M)
MRVGVCACVYESIVLLYVCMFVCVCVIVSTQVCGTAGQHACLILLHVCACVHTCAIKQDHMYFLFYWVCALLRVYVYVCVWVQE